MSKHQFISKEGQQVPDVAFKTRDNYEWGAVQSKDLFAGRNVVVFSLPGAFTPTCSSTHVPRFNELASVFKEEGIDEIVCLSVNDPFVMQAWANDQEAENIRFLSDGNGEFTRGMGMLVGKEDLCFGSRSWRYSMLVRDGVVEKMFIEPDVDGDPFEVSDADTMLAYLNPQAVKPHQAVMLTKTGCGFCVRAKEALHAAGIAFVEMNLPNATRGVVVGALAGHGTVPQLFVDGALVGGSDAIIAWAQTNGNKEATNA